MVLFAAVSFLPDWLGAVSSLFVFGVLIWSVIRYLVKPLSRKITLAGVARLVEQRHPELQERISTAVQLLASEDPREMKGSEQLIQLVVNEAITDVSAVDPQTEFTRRTIKPAMVTAAVFLGILLLSFVIWPHLTPRLFAKVVVPFANLGNAYAGLIEVEPGDAILMKGEKFSVHMSIDKEDVRRAELRIDRGNVEPLIERMTRSDGERDGETQFVIQMSNVTNSFVYRVRSLKAESPDYQVTVVDRPEITRIDVSYDYPAYTGLEDKYTEDVNGIIIGPVHSNIRILTRFNTKPVSASLFVGTTEFKPVAMRETETGVAAEWDVALSEGLDDVWHVKIEDEHGFVNLDTTYPIKALPDRAPEITILAPEERELLLRPTELLPVDYYVTEDYGIQSLEVKVALDGATEPIPQKIPVSLMFPKRVFGQAALGDLASLDLDGKTTVEVQLHVQDTLPEDMGGAREGFSDRIRITLDRQAKSLLEQQVEAQQVNIERSIREVLDRLFRARGVTHHTPDWLREKNDLEEWIVNEIKKASDVLDAASNGLKDLVSDVMGTAFANLGPELYAVDEENVMKSIQSNELIQLTDENNQRIEHAKVAGENVDIAIKRLEQLLHGMRERREQADRLAEVTDLAKEEFQLAREAEELANRETSEAAASEAMEKWQQEQEQLARELGEMVKADEAALAEELASERRIASKLAEEALELAGEQEVVGALSEQLDRATGDELDAEEELTEALLVGLQKRQQDIAEETRALQEDIKNLAREHTGHDNTVAEMPAEAEKGDALESVLEALSDASKEARETAENIGAESLEEAMDNAEQTREVLAQAGEILRGAKPEPETSTTRSENMPEEGTSPSGFEIGGVEDGQASESNESSESFEALDSGNNLEGLSGDEQPANHRMPSESATPESAESGPQATKLATQVDGLVDEQEAIQDALQALEEGGFEQALGSLQDALEVELGELLDDAQQLSAAQEALSNNAHAEDQAEAGAEALGKASETLAADQTARESDAVASGQGEPSVAQAPAGSENVSEPLGEAPESASPPSTGSASTSTATPPSNTPGAPSSQAASSAAESLEDAAEAFSALEEMLAAQENQLGKSDSPESLLDKDQLSTSFGEAADASAAQSPAEAAESASSAAQAMADMANAAAKNLGMSSAPGLPGQSPGQPPQNTPGQGAQAGTPPSAGDGSKTPLESGDLGSDVKMVKVPDWLADLGVSSSDWIRMRALGANEVEGAVLVDTPEEYHDLVNRYFREVARESARKKRE